MFTFAPSAAYFPDDFVIIELRAITSINNHWIEISNIEFDFFSGRGNV